MKVIKFIEFKKEKLKKALENKIKNCIDNSIDNDDFRNALIKLRNLEPNNIYFRIGEAWRYLYLGSKITALNIINNVLLKEPSNNYSLSIKMSALRSLVDSYEVDFRELEDFMHNTAKITKDVDLIDKIINFYINEVQDVEKAEEILKMHSETLKNYSNLMVEYLSELKILRK